MIKIKTMQKYKLTDEGITISHNDKEVTEEFVDKNE